MAWRGPIETEMLFAVAYSACANVLGWEFFVRNALIASTCSGDSFAFSFRRPTRVDNR